MSAPPPNGPHALAPAAMKTATQATARRPRRFPLPTRKDDLTAAFVDACLRSSGTLDGSNEVVKVEASDVGTGGNTGAALVRVTITYANNDDDKGKALPRTLVCKMVDTSQVVSPTNRDKLVERLMMYTSGYSDVSMLQLETSFYGELRKLVLDPTGVEAPKSYYAQTGGTSNFASATMFIVFKRKERFRGAVLMEDLGGGTTWNAVETVPTPVAERIMRLMGRLHGATAKLLKENPALERRLPLAFNFPMNTMSKGPAYLHKLTVMRAALADEIFRRWGDSDYRVLRDEPDTMEALRALTKVYRRRIPPQVRRRHPFVCCLHGDMHAGNVMVMPDDSTRLFDWQMWGIGALSWEVAYFLASNVDADPVQDERLLRLYHAELESAAGGAASYPFPLLKRDVDVVTIDYLSQALVRRGAHETPASVARANERDYGFTAGIQHVCTAREARLLRRLRDVWRRDPSFAFELLES